MQNESGMISLKITLPEVAKILLFCSSVNVVMLNAHVNLYECVDEHNHLHAFICDYTSIYKHLYVLKLSNSYLIPYLVMVNNWFTIFRVQDILCRLTLTYVLQLVASLIMVRGTAIWSPSKSAL